MRPSSALCPPTVVEAFIAYRDEGRPPGDFIRACLENNLMEAFKAADETNLEAMPHIVAWLYWEMPTTIWKSRAAVNQHLLEMRRPEKDEPVVYNRGELPPRDARDEHDKSL